MILSAKPSIKGFATAERKAITQTLSARLNIAPIAFSVRKLNLFIVPKERHGSARSAIV